MMAEFSIMYVSVTAQNKAGRKDTIRHTILFTCLMDPEVVMNNFSCPMHSDVTSNKPGKCSKCSMELKEKSQ